jgi:hypothetical protein
MKFEIGAMAKENSTAILAVADSRLPGRTRCPRRVDCVRNRLEDKPIHLDVPTDTDALKDLGLETICGVHFIRTMCGSLLFPIRLISLAQEKPNKRGLVSN